MATNTPSVGSVFSSLRLHVADDDTVHRFVGDVVDFLDRIGRHENDFVVGARAVEHDFRRAEFVAPVQQRHAFRELGQKRRFFHRRVAPANHDDFAVAEKGAIAGRASGNAEAQQVSLRFDPEHPRRGPGGDNQRLGLVGFFRDGDLERALAQVHGRHGTGLELSAETLRLFSRAFDQLRSQNPFGKAGEVLNLGGQSELSAGLVAVQNERLQVRTSGIDGGGQPRAAATDDDHLVH